MSEQTSCIARTIEAYVYNALNYLNYNYHQYITGEYIQRCISMAKDLRGHEVINGRNPRSIAGAILWIGAVMCDSAITQKDCANSVSTTEVTIRKNWKPVAKALGVYG